MESGVEGTKTYEKEKKKKIATRGIPSKESFYLPAHYSDEIRKFQDEHENLTRNLWNLKEVLNFIFPEKYQKTYNEIAVSFIGLVCQNLIIEGNDISNFIREKGISKATFYNRVLPRLKRVGMLKVERTPVETGSSKKAKMRITLSRTFGNYLNKISDSWLAVVDDAKTRKK